MNGPAAAHQELALCCDITLCTEDTTFGEPHYYAGGTPSGDGLYLTFQECFGLKRANNMVMLGQTVSAQEALDAGVVAEVLDKDKIWDRAWEIARKTMTHDRYCRRIEHEIMMQRWRRVINADYNMNFIAEEWGELLNDPAQLIEISSHLDDIDSLMEDGKV